jgi:hypothetical protein
METLRAWSDTEERRGREWLNSTRRKDKDGWFYACKIVGFMV